MNGVSQQLQFNHFFCGLFITGFNCACRDLNFRLQLCAVIKFRAKLKLPSRHTFLLCRDIISFVATLVSCGRTINHQATTSGIS